MESTQEKSSSSSISCFKSLSPAPYDPVFDVHAKCTADKSDKKIDGLNGLYFDESLRLYTHDIIKKVEAEILTDPSLTYHYLPADGHPGFNAACEKTVFEGTKPYAEGRISSCQTISATGALRLSFEILTLMGLDTIHFFTPNWPSFWSIATGAGMKINELRFLDDKGDYSFDLMKSSLENVKDGSAVIFHTSANNPTGYDSTKDEAKELAQICKKKKLIPFLDSAYSGYASGDLRDDADIVKIFVEEDLPVFVQHSFGKTFTIYGERIGSLHIVCDSKETKNLIQDNLKFLAKRLYTAPPKRGALIVYKILTTPEYLESYRNTLNKVSEDLKKRREVVREAIEKNKVPGDWSRITKQRGIFMHLGLSVTQIDYIAEKHHIYFQKNGRFSVCSLNESNIAYFVDALKDTLTPQLDTDSQSKSPN